LIDVVQALGLAGIHSVVAAPPSSLARYSRFTSRVLEWADPWTHPEELVERLISFADEQPERAVLYYSSDGSLLAVSRFRDRLGQSFRFVLPDEELLETLLDKARFQPFAEKLGLPVPRAQLLSPEKGSTPADVDLEFPLIVKPLVRSGSWSPLAEAKALRVDTPQHLSESWPRLVEANLEVLVQELIPGPETQVESYHVYVAEDGQVLGEFAGQKIRTHPREFGYSSALITTDHEDVFELGRKLSRRLGLRGVAKFDFKRGPDGRLYLLEINPRFNLWHHLGARAGVNLPQLVYDDLARGFRPDKLARARVGARWCSPRHDLGAARREGVPFLRWLAWAISCEAKSGFSRDDPLPVIRGTMWRLRHRVRGAAMAGPPRAETSRPSASLSASGNGRHDEAES
jgi:predicted ATP-grasp superfamily ATP-dependent carboligase